MDISLAQPLKAANYSEIDKIDTLTRSVKIETIIDSELKRLKSTIYGHSEIVTSVAITSDSKYIVSGSRDMSLRIWKFSERKQVSILQGHTGYISSISLSQDDKLIISGSWDMNVKIWSLPEAKLITTLYGHNSYVNSVCISPLSNFIASASRDKCVKVWNLQQKTEEFTLNGHAANVNTVVFSSDGSFLVSCSDDKTIRIWNFKTQEMIRCIKGPLAVICICLSANKKIFSADTGDTIKIWDLESGEESGMLKGHTGGVKTLVLSQDEKRLISGGADKSIKVWSLKGNKEIYTLQGHSNTVRSAVINSSRKYIISGSEDKTIRIWNLLDQREKATFKGHSTPVISVAVTSNGKIGATGSKDKTIKLWDLDLYQEIGTLIGHLSSVNALIFIPNSKYLLSCSNDFTVRLWDHNEKKELWVFRGHTDAVVGLSVNSDGSLAFSGSFDFTVRVWNLNLRTEEVRIEGFRGVLTSLTLTPNGKNAIVGYSDGIVHVHNWSFLYAEGKQYSVIQQRYEWVAEGHTGGINSVAVSDDGSFFVSGSEDALVKVWSMKRWREEFTLEGHSGPVTCVVVSANNRLILSASYDKSVRVWDIEERKEKCTFMGHAAAVMCITLSPNLKSILTGSADKTLKVWTLQKRREFYTYTEHSATVYSIAITNDSSLLISVSGDECINVWDPIRNTHIKCIKGINSKIYAVAACSYKRYFVTGSENRDVTLWNLDDFKQICTLSGHTYGVSSLAINIDGKYIVSGSKDRTIRLWDFNEQKQIFAYVGHTDFITSVDISENGNFIVSGSLDRSVKVWSTIDHSLYATFLGHNEAVNGVKISSDCQRVLSGSDDCIIRIWNVIDKKEELSFLNPFKVTAVTLNTDGNYAVAGLENGNIFIWNIEERRIEANFEGHTNSVNTVVFASEEKYIYSASSDFSLRKWSLSDVKSISDQIDFKNKFSVSFNLNKESDEVIYSEVVKRINYTPEHYILIDDGRYVQNIASVNSQKTFELSHSLRKILFYSVRPTDLYDCYYQDPANFYNVIDCLQYEDMSKLSQHSGSVYFSEYLFTITHVICATGQSDILERLCKSPTFILRTDFFGKSPLFYSITRKHQKCTDILLEMFSYLLENTDKTRFITCAYAIRNDFIPIILNSSTKLGPFLDSLLITSDSMFAKINTLLPAHAFSISVMPNLSEFVVGGLDQGLEEIPVILKYTPLPIMGTLGSTYNSNLLKAILNCKNDQVYRSAIIQFFIEYNWSYSKYFTGFYSSLLFLNTVFMVLFIGFPQSLFILVLFIFINFLLLLWELAQLKGGLKQYFEDPWNYLDVLRILLTIPWMILREFEYDKTWDNFIYLEWSMALTNLYRGITAFRLLDGTRFYVNLIFTSISNMKYFLIIFFYFTLSFGVLFMIAERETLSVTELLIKPWELNFGQFSEPSDKAEYTLSKTVFFVASIINVVIMLNLLISILGDSYEQFQLDQLIIDYKEKVGCCIGVQPAFFWLPKASKLLHLHILDNPDKENGDDQWEGKIRFIEDRINIGMVDMSRNLVGLNEKMDNRFDEIENKIETKINMLENKFRILDGRIKKYSEIAISDERNTFRDADDIKNMVEGVENRVGLVENKVQELDERIKGFDEKLDRILEAVNRCS